MVPLALPFEPSYIVLKNLHYKVHKHSITLVNLTLPLRPQDPSTNVNPYLDNAIGILSKSTTFLYNNKAPWAVRVTEVKSKVLTTVDKVNIKVDKIKANITKLKTDVTKLKMDIAKLKTNITKLKIDIIKLKTDVVKLKTDITKLKTEIKSQEERLIV